jgi:hypothetical protein
MASVSLTEKFTLIGSFTRFPSGIVLICGRNSGCFNVSDFNVDDIFAIAISIVQFVLRFSEAIGIVDKTHISYL